MLEGGRRLLVVRHYQKHLAVALILVAAHSAGQLLVQPNYCRHTAGSGSRTAVLRGIHQLACMVYAFFDITVTITMWLELEMSLRLHIL